MNSSIKLIQYNAVYRAKRTYFVHVMVFLSFENVLRAYKNVVKSHKASAGISPSDTI